GRADNPGEALTFVTEEDEHHFKVIQKKMKKVVDLIDNEEVTSMIESTKSTIYSNRRKANSKYAKR
ncbi:MAG: hypothetical protein AB8B56_14840, partial [Crocinitomicaceae bacterium]